MNREPSPDGDAAREDRATRWLSHGFETLIAALDSDPDRTATGVDFDVVIVGTGYGGSVAAAELAKTRGNRRVCVLERGTEHLPGSFPARMAEVPGHVRFSTKGSRHPRGEREGLFDVRVGDDLCALLANGLGGGSLINAGVMAFPDQKVFNSSRWPAPFHEATAVDALSRLSADLAQRLGATQTIKSVNQPEPLKYAALGALAGAAGIDPLPITVALGDASGRTFQTAAGVRIDACVRCGNCATGCNHNAKISLDVTLLAEARQHGAELFTGATVLKIEKLARARGEPVWQLHVVHTDGPLRRRQGQPTLVRSRRVVLAAGTFGSTEILLRSQGEHLRLSRKLGHQVSSNGDLIAAAYAGKVPVNCVGDEDEDPRLVPVARQVGPTITGMIDLRERHGMLIQDLAVPAPLRSALEQTVATAAAFHMLAESDERRHGAATRDPCAIDPDAIRNTLVVAIIGHDTADGVMKLNSGKGRDIGDGAATIHWPTLKSYPPLMARHRRFEQMVRESGSGARVLTNPMWTLLPEQLSDLFEGEAGPLFTVHPLGGCPMGDDVAAGVVDDCGRVFDASEGGRLHDGLVVLDGSIVPASLGINPALAIATLALRAIGALRAEWDYLADGTRIDIGNRPCFKGPASVEAPQDTMIEVLERLSGPVPIKGMTQPQALAADQTSGPTGGGLPHVELTMRFDPISTRRLGSGTDAATLGLQAAHGRLRIFRDRPPDDAEADDRDALLVATVSGTLRAFSHQESSPIGRRLRGIWAWFRNRGLRDTVQWVIDRYQHAGPAPASDKTLWQEAISRGSSVWSLSSRAGAVRLLEYQLVVEDILRSSVPADLAQAFRGAAIKGRKQVTYGRRANPWRQLMEVSLDVFPRAARAGAVLTLDTGFLARQRVPLVRVVQQQDHAKALVDVASLGLYVMRMLIHIHLWSFRLPDAPAAREIQRLPGFVPGLPPPEIHEFPVDRPRNGMPVMVRLTRYRYDETRRSLALQAAPAAGEAIRTPILLIHGYSASGTTFAHHAVRPNVASSLWDRGRDVWIVDLRTSAGMPHAKSAWTFEQVGMADIPLAIAQVCAFTGAKQIDVFAHCMGSAMLGMALLGPEKGDEACPQLRRQLPARIRRLAMSQVAPAVVFTPANVFRAYAMQYLRHYLPLYDYQFRPPHQLSRTNQVIDRLLATLPYPEEEFDRENPFWPPWRRTPWVGTRHRMDALYGRDFSVNNLPSKVLDYIDDHFGPLSIETVSQAIHFARLRTITNRQGFNDYVRPDRLREQLRFPLLHVHGRDNGLVSKQTPQRFRQVLIDSDARFESDHAFRPALYDAGHQDLLIGTPAAAMFKDLNEYLEDPVAGTSGEPLEIRLTFMCQVPSFGVRLPAPFASATRCSLGDEDAGGALTAALLIPVMQESGGGYRPVDETGRPVPATADDLAAHVEWRALQPVSPQEKSTRFTFELADYAPPVAACGILILLLYSQSADCAGAPAAGTSHSLHRLALHIASKSNGGKGLAQLAGLLADPNGVTLAGQSGPESLARTFVEPMAKSVERAFERIDIAELELGILRPPKRGESPPAHRSLSFALASCQYPGGLLDRTPPGAARGSLPGPSDASYLRLLALLEGQRDLAAGSKPPLPLPEFLVLAGDQIYADATAGLFDPRRLDDRIRISYESFFGARGPRSVLSRLPAVMRLDDHEIDDNWEPDPAGVAPRAAHDTQALKEAGVRQFLRNQCDQEPDPSMQPKLWQRMPLAGFEFFWADARTERTPRTASTVATASLLGEAQSIAVDAWLADKRSKGPRFLVSAGMVLPRHVEMRHASVASAIRSDAWDGYPASLHRLLAAVYERGLDDVVFLSGDEHISNVVEIQISKPGVPGVVHAHSIHSSALYAPYPFANGTEADFANHEDFEFSHAGVMYRCHVETWYPQRGDGFAVLSVAGSHGTGAWQVSVQFDREQPSTANRNSFDIVTQPTENPLSIVD